MTKRRRHSTGKPANAPQGLQVNLAELLKLKPEAQIAFLVEKGFTPEEAQDLIARWLHLQEMVEGAGVRNDDARDDHSDDPRRGVFVATVLLSSAKPNFKRMKALLTEYHQEVIQRSDAPDIPAEAWQKTIFLGVPEEGMYAVVDTDECVPRATFAKIAEESLFCPTAATLLEAHRSTVNVVVHGNKGDRPLDNSRQFLLMLYAVMKDDDALALWINGILVDKARFFRMATQLIDSGAFDAEVFVPVRLIPEKDGYAQLSLHSLGCVTFGFPEFEVRHITALSIDQWLPALYTVMSKCLWDDHIPQKNEILTDPTQPQLPSFRVTRGISMLDDWESVILLEPIPVTSDDEAHA